MYNKNRSFSRFLYFVIFFPILFLNNYNCQINTNNRPVLNIIKTDRAIELTGKLDSPAWALTQPVELNYETEPGNNIPASQKTMVYALYDDKNIYFGFKCLDTNPGQIRGNITDRDKMYSDDYVQVNLDLYGDYQRTYKLAVNPYGIKGDILNENISFDMIWEAYAAKNPNGWIAEIAIPFSSLNFPQKDEQEWIIGIERNYPRENNKTFSWTRWDKNIPNPMQQAGILRGLKNIISGGSVEILPYLMGQQSGYISDRANPASGINYDPIVGRIGGGITYSPSSNFKLEAVLNPDFSQIESDEAQISVNTTFALYYPEKRPFFLSGTEILSNILYYTRSINDPLFAAKATGKSGSLSYFYQGAYDRNTIFTIPGEEQSNTVPTALKSFSNIGRVIYDFGDESFIGAAILTKNVEEGHNYVYVLDGIYKVWQNWYFSGRFYFSHTKELNNPAIFNSTRKLGNTPYTAGFNGEEFWGNRISLGIDHVSRNYTMSFEYEGNAPDVQIYNALYTTISQRRFGMNNNYIFYPDNSFIDKGIIGLYTNATFNYNGARKNLLLSPSVSLTMKGQTNLYLSYNLVNEEKYLSRDFLNVNNATIRFTTNPLKELSFGLNAQIGNFIYYSSDPTLGNGHNISGTIQVKPTSQLNISFSYSRAKLKNNDTGELYFDGNIYRIVGIYQFSQEMFFRTILQYDTFENTFQLYPLFSYKMNAFTTFYAGATSNYYNYEGEFGFRNTEQQYFIKIQYLLGI